MTTVTIEVADIETTKQRMKAAFRGEPQGCFITFPSHEDLWSTLTANRWAILKALTGAGPLGVRELARRVGRDVKGVHTDAQVLVQSGVIDKAADGTLLFPYDMVHVEFMLKAA
ncbi:transcriptional regulator [uncultured Thiodictyon sp.]|uniref:HVO_A0114 family putative DNA-binding protein n=1 Tax=uncultured Thiodictyon sp. TaxID=1846217 RepID=UPI0025F4B1D3|nr:transcriptional regulator [uncultured Thiodictyon sp.]